MSLTADAPRDPRDLSFSIAGLRFAVFTTRNMVYLMAVLAMNYTIMRPSPVDLLFITSFLMTLAHIALSERREVTRRAVFLMLIIGAWAVSYLLASLPHIREPKVPFELLAKTFAISIGIIAAFVSMSWTQRHFETFMKVYIVSSVIGATLGTIGFALQLDALTWDGRARGLIDDPNMYGAFLFPGVLFSAYFLFRPRSSKIVLLGVLMLLLLGIFLSFSRVAVVAIIGCLLAYVVFHNWRHPKRLLVGAAGLVGIAGLLLALASVASPEFTEKLLDRMTFAKSYDLGEDGRYARYFLVLPMILQNPIGMGVLQLEKIFPEPIHNIWLSSFVNYGWLGGFSWIVLVVSSVVVSILNYRRTRSHIPIVLMISLIGIILCATLHEGEHWRHMWLTFGLIWGFCTLKFEAATKVAGGRPAPAAAQG